MEKDRHRLGSILRAASRIWHASRAECGISMTRGTGDVLGIHRCTRQPRATIGVECAHCIRQALVPKDTLKASRDDHRKLSENRSSLFQVRLA
jgi:hypothetical protein